MPSMEFEASEPRKLFFPDADQNDLQTLLVKVTEEINVSASFKDLIKCKGRIQAY